jgi:hypothetical protein
MLLPAAGLALLVALLVPLPRNGLPTLATVATLPAGPKQLALDRYGQASLFQRVRVEVRVDPRESARLRTADWFWVTSWQGGGSLTQPLKELSPGVWVATQPVPTGGAWKTIVLLARGDVLAAVPVSLPADPALGLRAVPVQASRTQAFAPASRYLTRESHGGASWPAILVYALWVSMVGLWLAVIITGARSLLPPRAGPASERRAAMLGLRRMATRVPLHSSR